MKERIATLPSLMFSARFGVSRWSVAMKERIATLPSLMFSARFA
jgi:hypothetical protein